MRLSKAQKAALLLGAFSVISDQISDVWMAFNYHFNCHYVWSRTAFILTFWHLPMAGLMANLTCYEDIKTRFIATIKGIFSPFWMVFYVIQILKSHNQNQMTNKFASIKIYKVSEIVVEACWQLLLNLYTRSYMASLNAVHLLSILLSFLAILNIYSDAFVCFHARTLSPKLIDVLKAMMFLSPYVLMLFGSFTVSVLTFEFYCTICHPFTVVMLTCIHIYICKGDLNLMEIKE